MDKVINRWINLVIVIGVLAFLTSSCKKDSATPAAITVTDADGNIYHTVTIGTQTWMVENLRTTKYNDSTDIPLVSNADAWEALQTDAYVNYNNTLSNSIPYGRLYNFYAVINAHKLCPTGWHIPTDEEFTTLINYLGGDSVAGGKLKETGTTHWNTPNTGAKNTYGFMAMPGGECNFYGSCDGMGVIGQWWTSTSSDYSATYVEMFNNYNGVKYVQMYKTSGFSVRCIRDK